VHTLSTQDIKATERHSEYIIVIIWPLQNSLRELASMLRL